MISEAMSLPYLPYTSDKGAHSSGSSPNPARKRLSPSIDTSDPTW